MSSGKLWPLKNFLFKVSWVKNAGKYWQGKKPLWKLSAWIKNYAAREFKACLKLQFFCSDGENKTKSMEKFAFHGKQNSSYSL